MDRRHHRPRPPSRTHAGPPPRTELAHVGVDYEPYVYATGLIDRVWSRYRTAVETNWRPFLAGRTTRDEAATATVAALTD
jgi:hypothetical protein